MTLKPIDIFQLLTPREKQQVIATLQIEQTACARNGHKFKAVKVNNYILFTQTQFICTACGATKWV